MNFRDGDIDRYYMPTVAVLAPLLGVAAGRHRRGVRVERWPRSGAAW